MEDISDAEGCVYVQHKEILNDYMEMSFLLWCFSNMCCILTIQKGVQIVMAIVWLDNNKNNWRRGTGEWNILHRLTFFICLAEGFHIIANALAWLGLQ